MYTIQTGRDRSFMKGDSVQKRLQSSSCHQRDFGYQQTVMCALKSVENTSTKNTNLMNLRERVKEKRKFCYNSLTTFV